MKFKFLQVVLLTVLPLLTLTANAGLMTETFSQSNSGGPELTTLDYSYDLSGIDWLTNDLVGATWTITTSINDTLGDDFFYFESMFQGVSTFAWPNEGGNSYVFDVTSLVGQKLLSSSVMIAYINTTDFDGSFNDSATFNTVLTVDYQVPEPSTVAIFGLGLMGLAARRFKKQ